MFEQEMDLLGKQLLLALRFGEQGFPEDASYECAVTDSQVLGRDLFHKENQTHFMAFDSLPGHLAVKAIGVTPLAILLETSRVVTDEAKKILADAGLPVVIGRDNVSKDGRVIIKFRYPSKGQVQKGLDNRCLWTMHWSKLNAADRQVLIRVADALYSGDAFEEDGVTADNAVVTSVQGIQRMALQLQTRLTQTLEQEQRPELALTTEMQLRPEVALHMEQRLRHMTQTELIAEFEKDPTPDGQRRLLNFIVFTLASDVKKGLKETKPDMTWKEARQLARKLIKHLAGA